MNQRFITVVVALSFILHGYIGQGDAAFTIFHGNDATRMNSRLSLQNSELLQYAAKTGQNKWIEMTGFHQTVITQDGVNITLDCGSLLTGVHSGGNISWSRLSLNNKGQIDTYRDFESIADGVGHYSLFGTGRSKLSFSTSIRRSAGDTILNSGIFKCEVCSVTESFSVFKISISPECSHRNTTLFVVGGPPVIDAGHSTDDPVDQVYKAGTNFCLKRLQSVRLECGLLNSFDKKRGTSSPAFPPPLLTWTLNNNLVYREKINDSHPLINMTFLMTGDNMLLAPGLIYPPPLIIEGNTIQLDLRAINTSRVLPALLSGNIQNRLIETLLGSWTCTQSNVYGSSSATTIITDCNEPSSLSFNISHYIVNESQRSIKVCVHRSGEASQFQVLTIDNEAKESVDYVGINATMNIDSPHRCFQVYIVNDNISEVVESFYLHLESHQPGVNLTIVNQTLTIVIKDDDITEEEGARCTTDEFLLVDNIKKEKERVVEAITKLLPIKLPPSSSPNPALSLFDAYEQLAEVLNSTATPDGFSHFSANVDEISTSYMMECSHLVKYIPGRYNVTALAATFTKSLSSETRNLTKARSIYGRFLCYNERAQELKRQRIKRQEPHKPLDPSTCDTPGCPTTIEEPCHFFNCLNVCDFGLFLFGNVNDSENEPCIGFLIDTTGSMRDEIESAKVVILQFLKTQQDSAACYILVPFNDYDDDVMRSVGPVTHVLFKSETEVQDLITFKERLGSLYAHGGGDHEEYALSAMMKALEYSFIDDFGDVFTPMHKKSAMVVLTDAGSKLEGLEHRVIFKAIDQGVSISFMTPGYLSTYSVYSNISRRTGGVHVIANNPRSWNLTNFITEFSKEPPKMKCHSKRSISSISSSLETFSVNVSRFTYSLKVSVLSRSIRSGTIRITLPDMTTETTLIEDHVMTYLKTDPPAGRYGFGIRERGNEVSVQQQVALDVSFLYMNSMSTIASVAPPPACTSGKLALISSKSSEILSMSLNERDSHGNSRLIPLTKCGNAFKCDYTFNAGSFRYGLHGIDINGTVFTYDINNAVFESNGARFYSLLPLNNTRITILYAGTFNIYFKLLNKDAVGSTNFSLSVNYPEGFATTLNPRSVLLHPKETQTIHFSARVYSNRVVVGTTYRFTLNAANGCVNLSAPTEVTVNPLPTPPESTSATNVCGCRNGGTCVIYTRRRRTLRRCDCTPQFTGSKCQIRI